MLSKPIQDEATDIISAFKPNRKTRREYAGATCGMCGLGIVARDFALVVIEGHLLKPTPRPIHQQCTGFLFDLVEEKRAEYEDGPAEDPA